MTVSYINQNQSVKALRAWAIQKGYVMRKCDVLLRGSQAYKLCDKTNNNKQVSRYFTLYDVTQINNCCSEGFDYLIV